MHLGVKWDTQLISWLLDRMWCLTRSGKPLPLFSPWPSPECVGVNLFDQFSGHHSPDLFRNPYVFPPIYLIPYVLLRSARLTFTLIVPDVQPRRFRWPFLPHKSSSSLRLGLKVKRVSSGSLPTMAMLSLVRSRGIRGRFVWNMRHVTLYDCLLKCHFVHLIGIFGFYAVLFVLGSPACKTSFHPSCEMSGMLLSQ